MTPANLQNSVTAFHTNSETQKEKKKTVEQDQPVMHQKEKEKNALGFHTK